jgi:FHS family L-fucose permease-like MFS transporter
MPTLKQDSRSSEPPRLFAVGNTLPFILVTALFLFWGVPSNMNDILIKQFMKSFEITRFRAGLIQSAFYNGLLPACGSLRPRDAEIWV